MLRTVPSPESLAGAGFAGEQSTTKVRVISCAARRVGGPTLITFAVVTAWLIVGWGGLGPAARAERILSSLDPMISALRSGGEVVMTWLFEAKATVAAGVGIACIFLAAAGVRRSGRAGLTHAVGGAGIAFATCGEVALLSDHTRMGVILFLVGLAFAALFGRLAPLARLSNFPPIPALRRGERSADPGIVVNWHPAAEAGVVVSLSIAALLLRSWALTELPDGFDDEMIGVVTGSATNYGFIHYVNNELLGTGNGIFHFLTQRLCYELFGYSVYALRLAAVLWGVLAIPIFYALVRRLAGPWPAVAATLLFATGPEQLFWSRTENTFFAPVAAVTLVTVHLALSLALRPSAGSAIAAALFMPFCRFSYTPSFVLFTVPLGVFAHRVVFGSGYRKRALAAGPILAMGVLLWILGPSLLVFATHPDQPFRFINPTRVHGEVAWRHGVERDAGLLETVAVQATRVARNAAVVAEAATRHPRHQSHWYVRRSASLEHDTLIVPGLAVLAALGIAMLLGQPGDPRAGLLIVWLVAGLLPACMSDQPEARRLIVLFPAFPVAAVLFCAATVRALRERAGGRTSNVAAFAFGAAIVLTGFAGLTSHLRLRAAPLPQEAQMRFAEPLLERSDAVLHNLFHAAGSVIALRKLDRLIDSDSPLCMQYVAGKDWRRAVLFPECLPTDSIYRTMLPPEEIAARQHRPKPKRIGFLVSAGENERTALDLVRSVYPAAPFREAEFLDNRLVAVDVARRDIEELHEVDLVSGPGIRPEAPSEALLEETRVIARRIDGGAPSAGTVVVRGSVLLPEDGWWKFSIEPACDHAALTIADGPAPATAYPPRLAGLYPFELRLKAGSCPTPLRIVGARPGDAAGARLGIVAGRLADLPALGPGSFLEFPGYGAASRVTSFEGRAVSLAVDSAGTLHLLAFKEGRWQLRSFRPGSEGVTVHPDIPRDPGAGAMAVDEDGTCIVTAVGKVETWRDGARQSAFGLSGGAFANDVAVVGEEILFTVPARNSIERYRQDGSLTGSIREVSGAAGRLPAGVEGLASSPRGDVLVTGSGAAAMVLRLDAAGGPPSVRSSFTVAYGEVPFATDVRAAAFDGDDRILFPHHRRKSPVAHAVTGERLMASTADGELARADIRRAALVAAGVDALFVADPETRAILRVERR